MPSTPLHLGPNCFLGLVFKRWLDVPVFVVAGLWVDIEVLVVYLLQCGPIYPRYGHTLLIAGAVGVLWSLAAYPLRGLFKGLMQRLRLPYDTSLSKMMVSGILGAWVHVLVDGFYRLDVVLFWPSMMRNPLCRFDKNDVEAACIVLLFASLIPFGAAWISRQNRNAGKKGRQD